MRANAPRERNATVPEPADTDDESFRVISITSARAPSGCEGRDWLVYRIAQGKNIITGYRRGELKTASAEVETIVTSLNQRRHSNKTKPGRKPGRREAPPKDEPA